MADNYEGDQPDSGTGDGGPSVFDIFDPPPPRDPSGFGKVPVIKDDDVDLTDGKRSAEVQAAADAQAAGLQHWTAPATGQVPAILSDKEGKGDTWANVAGPSWHGEDPSWTGPDLADVFADADAIRFDDDDDEDDDEEDDGYRRPPAPARPPRSDRPPAPRPHSGEVPLAPGPERRLPPTGRAGPVVAPIADRPRGGLPSGPPSGEVPMARPGADADETGWPTSTEAGPPPGRPAAPRPRPRPRPEAPSYRTGEPTTDRPGRPDRPEWTGSRRPDGDGPAGVFDRGDIPRDDIPSIDDIHFAGEHHDQAEHHRQAEQHRQAEHQQAERFRGDQRLGRPDHDGPDRGRRPGRRSVPAQALDERLDRLEGLDLATQRSGGRNVPVAIAVGAALVAVLLAAMWFGSETTLLLVVVLALVGVAELFNAMRTAGLRPATLLGVVGTVAAPLAAYYRGDGALPLLIGLTVIFGSLWYLVGADTERPVLNLSLTMMGIFWVGGLASFAGLTLRAESDGIQLLLAAIIITVVSDTMAYVGGRAYGQRPFHPASPNKTWEGTMTGFLASVFAGLVIGVVGLGTLWDGNLVPALALGVTVGVLAPIGDLAESVIKRDLGVKDMGHLLPGHGGVLDRVDALLFVLPGAYYLGLVAGLI